MAKRPRKPRSRSKRQTFRLRSKQLRAAVNASIKEAERALAAGQRAVGSARRRKDVKAVENNAVMLRDTRNALRGLRVSLKALEDICCDQFLNCDPSFEG
jgi:hypothetical protein